MKKCRILVVSKDIKTINSLRKELQNEGYIINIAQSNQEAMKNLRKRKFELIITELSMSGINATEILKESQKIDAKIKVIILTNINNLKLTIELIQQGAYEYLKKPFIMDELKILIRKALQMTEIIDKDEIFREKLKIKQENLLIGKSKKIQKVLVHIQKIAKTDLTVLIQGETGTGKELVASLIHNLSPRKNKPFLKVNCAALPDSLLESELFGYERGAFTGAVSTKHGLFSSADEGSILLDEISEICPEIQAKLLRVIETKEFFRVGGVKLLKVDVRIIASTNRDLEKDVKDGNFREDLYYRLNIFPLFIPPLRERREDIPFLIDYFLQRNISFSGKKRLSLEALDCLLNYEWPGNVRELKNVILRACILSGNSPEISVEHLPGEVKKSKGYSPTKKSLIDLPFKKAREKVIESFEKEYFQTLLYKNKGNISHSSKLAKLSRPYLHQKIKKYRINVKNYRNNSH